MSRSPLQFHLRGPSSRARSLPVLGSIAQTIHAFGTEAIDPFADGLRGRIELVRSRGFGHAAIRNGTHHFLSTFRGQASILMGVHSVLRESLRFGNISVPGSDRMETSRKFTASAALVSVQLAKVW